MALTFKDELQTNVPSDGACRKSSSSKLGENDYYNGNSFLSGDLFKRHFNDRNCNSDEEGGLTRRRASTWRRRSRRRAVSTEPIHAAKKTIVEASGEEDNTDGEKSKEDRQRAKTGILEFTPIRAGQDVTPANFDFRESLLGSTRGRHFSGTGNRGMMNFISFVSLKLWQQN